VKVKSVVERSRKRKVFSSSESEYDVEKDVQDIIPFGVKKSAGKKVMQIVENVLIDKVSFHLPENAQRWKFIYHWRLTLVSKLGKEALEIETVIELIKKAGLMKTISKLGDCYEQLVKEFLVNILYDCDNPLSKEYQKVYVIGECINFSYNIINRFLGVEETNILELEVTDNQVCKEITADKVNVWPSKKNISSGKLSVKYTILNRIDAANCVPTTHSSDIATMLGKFIYVVGS